MPSPLLALRTVLFATGASEVVTYLAPVTPSDPNPTAISVRMVRSGDMAGSLSGQGNPLTGISFEIPRGVLPAAPLQTGAITDTAGTVYRITQVTNQDFTNSFVCVVIQQ